MAEETATATVETPEPTRTVPRSERRITGNKRHRRRARNPIDPATGRRKVGRPRRETREGPIDNMMGIQPEEMAAREPIRVKEMDPLNEFSSAEAQAYYRKIRKRNLMDVPDEIQKKYPDGHFAWARNTPEGIAEYRDSLGFQLVEADPKVTGRADSLFTYRDAVLMVQPKWMKKVRDQAHRDAVLESVGAGGATEEVTREMTGVRGMELFTEDRTTRAVAPPSEEEEESIERAAARRAYARNPNRPKGSVGRGSKYVQGGFPT